MLADIIKRAEAGDADAQQELAHMYCHGPIYPSPPKGGWSASSGAGKSFDVPQIDTRKAAYWARRSANQGYVPAMVTLIAAIRDGGEGAPPDNIEVYKWALIASAHGMRVAAQHVEIIEGKGYLREPRLTSYDLKEGQRRALLYRSASE
jgi:TPR repeat protein